MKTVESPTRRRRQDTRMHPPGEPNAATRRQTCGPRYERLSADAIFETRSIFTTGETTAQERTEAMSTSSGSLEDGSFGQAEALRYRRSSSLISAAARSMAAITRLRSASDRSRILGMERLMAPMTA